MGKFRLFFALVTITMLLIATACSSGAEKTSNDNGGESDSLGRIAFYSPETPDMTKEIGLAFENANPGATVDMQYAGTNVLVNRMLAEIDNPQADVWYGGGGILPFEAAVDKGIIMPFTPDLAEGWDTVENGVKVKHEDGYYTGAEIFVLGFVYNTELVDEADLPKTWDDLLDPKWEGKIQFSNPAASGTATLMVLSQMMQRGEEAGWEYFQKLYDQANSVPDSGSGPTKAVAMGEALIGIGFDFMAYEQKAKGETIDFIVPESTPILVNPVALVKDGPNPEGGKALINYLLSEEGQQILADWYHIPINPNVESKTPLTLKSVQDNAIDLDVKWVVENYDRIRTEWGQKIK